MSNVVLASDYAYVDNGYLQAEVYLLNDAHPENRGVWAWAITTPEGKCSSDIDSYIYSGAMRIGSSGPQIMLTLASFLTAYAEAQHYPNSENRDLFPDEVGSYASDVADMISEHVFEED